MLTPEYLASCTEDLLEMVDEVNEQVTRDISRRIVKAGALTESADFQAELLRESGMLQKDIVATVAKNTGKTEAEVRRIFEESQRLNWDSENARAAKARFGPLDPSENMKTLMAAHLTKTAGEVRNLTMTTASQGQLSFFNACTTAHLQVSNGVFSPTEAVRQAIKSVARDGAWIQYPTGHRDRIDVAIRRAVLTGVNQSAAVVNQAYADEIGTDLVEVTAHAGARPDHAIWQGQVYSRSGKTPGYANFYDATGYGSGPGLCGWNCRHNFHAYYEGTPRTYTDKQLRELDSARYEHNGRTYTEYEANQAMRTMEREIRATKRELVGLDEGMKVTEDNQLKAVLESDFVTSAVKLKEQEKELRAFAKATKRRVDTTRVQVHAATTGKHATGFGRSVAQKAVHASKRKLRNMVPDGPFDDFDITKGGKYKLFPRNMLKSAYAKCIKPYFERQLRSKKNPNGIPLAEYKKLTAKPDGYIRVSPSYSEINNSWRSPSSIVLRDGQEETKKILKASTDKFELPGDYIGIRKVDSSYLKEFLGIDEGTAWRKGFDWMSPASADKAVEKINALVKKSPITIHDKAVTSISLVENLNYFDMRPIQIEIQIEKGTKGLLTDNFIESEFIARAGSGLEIIGAKRYNYIDKNGTEKYYIKIFARLIQ
jgi:hypothetical protein